VHIQAQSEVRKEGQRTSNMIWACNLIWGTRRTPHTLMLNPRREEGVKGGPPGGGEGNLADLHDSVLLAHALNVGSEEDLDLLRGSSRLLLGHHHSCRGRGISQRPKPRGWRGEQGRWSQQSADQRQGTSGFGPFGRGSRSHRSSTQAGRPRQMG
jgi:hypothetical protein